MGNRRSRFQNPVAGEIPFSIKPVSEKAAGQKLNPSAFSLKFKVEGQTPLVFRSELNHEYKSL
jgi:hypothetical protein